jgi:hypothetical protein
MNAATELRDEGTDLVLTNAGAQWRAKAFDCVIRRFEQAGPVGCLFETARTFAEEQGVGAPPHHNAWGALCLALSRQDVIVKTGGYVNSKTARSHARVSPVWRLKKFEVNHD